jgi:hypothetical protein
MSRLELAAEWQVQFGVPPPAKVRAELMRPVLVYRIQENAYGTSAPKGKSGARGFVVDANSRRFKTGTKIIREWRGKVHEVAVTPEGYVYGNDVYKSLSPIAFRITGTRWSGPAFFGTKPKESRLPRRARRDDAPFIPVSSPKKAWSSPSTLCTRSEKLVKLTF